MWNNSWENLADVLFTVLLSSSNGRLTKKVRITRGLFPKILTFICNWNCLSLWAYERKRKKTYFVDDAQLNSRGHRGIIFVGVETKIFKMSTNGIPDCPVKTFAAMLKPVNLTSSPSAPPVFSYFVTDYSTSNASREVSKIYIYVYTPPQLIINQQQPRYCYYHMAVNVVYWLCISIQFVRH